MTARDLPLWPFALAAWAATAFVVAVAATPARNGCDGQAIAGAIAWGGVPAIALTAVDVVRRRKLGAAILLGWTIVFAGVAWGIGETPPPDCDHLVTLLMNAFLLPLYAAGAVGLVGAVYVVWRAVAGGDGSSR